jgi:signal transduction histidine kinase
VRRQITRAILGVAVLLVVALGFPLAVVVQRFYEDRAVADLQRRAAETITEIALPFDRNELATVAAEPDSPGEFTVYDGQGRRMFGSGPASGGTVVERALRGRSASATEDGDLVLAAPVTDRASETVVGAVRLRQPNRVVMREVLRAWLAMAAAVAVALVGAGALARSQARRLAEPIAGLARHAEELGRGEFTAGPQPSGIAEIDSVAAALASSGQRLAALLGRERAFSADVSHQLRTPLTGLRLQLERLAREHDELTEIRRALAEVDRLEATVEHLLALSRDRQPVGSTLDVEALLDDVEQRWRDRMTTVGRQLVVERASAAGPIRASEASILQVLDVLIDNGLRHGAGDVTVRSRAAVGGVVIEVGDEGSGIGDTTRARLFERGAGNGHGIGLALARSLTEAEGGRLLLASAQPTCFHVVLPLAGDGDAATTVRAGG